MRNCEHIGYIQRYEGSGFLYLGHITSLSYNYGSSRWFIGWLVIRPLRMYIQVLNMLIKAERSCLLGTDQAASAEASESEDNEVPVLRKSVEVPVTS